MREVNDNVTRLITESSGLSRSILGVWDITSLKPEVLEHLRARHEREFVYARDYDDLRAQLTAAQEANERLQADLADCEKRQAADRKSALDNFAKWQAAESALATVRQERDEARAQLSKLEDELEQIDINVFGNGPHDHGICGHCGNKIGGGFAEIRGQRFHISPCSECAWKKLAVSAEAERDALRERVRQVETSMNRTGLAAREEDR